MFRFKHRLRSGLLIFSLIVSTFLITPSPAWALANWTGDIYANQAMDDVPAFTGGDGSWPGTPDLNLNWGQASPLPGVSNDFSARFAKTITVGQGGRYLFQAQANDGIRVYAGKLAGSSANLSSTSLVYSGAWNTLSSALNSGGTAKYSNSPVASVTVHFTGTGIEVGGYKSPWYGVAAVYLDDNQVGSVDYYSPSVKFQQGLFELNGLTNAPHTLKLVSTGKKNSQAQGTAINLDYVDVSNGSGLGPFQESNPSLHYSGSWAVLSSSANSGGHANYVSGNNASVALDFTGTSLQIGGYKSQWYGIADVYLDGNKVGSIDYYSPRPLFKQVLFTKNGLTNSTHSLKLVSTGGRNRAAVGSAINLDFISIGTTNPTGTLQEQSSPITYSGTWSNYVNPNNSGGSARFSRNGNASFTLNFTGQAVKIVGYKSPWYGIANVFLDGKKVGSIDYYNSTVRYQQTLFATGGLLNAPHTLTIVGTGSRNRKAQGTSINLDYSYITAGQKLGSVEESAAQLIYAGAWNTLASGANSAGHAKYSAANGASATLNFYGPSLTIGGYRSPWYGIAAVYLDGHRVGSIDYYSHTAVYRQALFTLSGLTNTTHTLKLVSTGFKNPLAQGNSINLDYINIGDGSGRFEDANLTNTSAIAADLAQAVNKQLVINSWHDASGKVSNSIYLAPGTYEIFVEYYHHSGPANLQLQITPFRKTIVLDPGHGGRDPGAVANGLDEKNINLAVAQKLATVLTGQGYQVKMTRTGDTDLAPKNQDYDVLADLKNRSNISNNSAGDIFVSIHSDWSSSSSAAGVLGTYFRAGYGYDGTYDYDPLAAKNWGLSSDLAHRIASSLANATAQPLRRDESHAFVVLRYNHLPATLVELGFLTNNATAAQMTTTAWQNKAASAIAAGINSYFSAH